MFNFISIVPGERFSRAVAHCIGVDAALYSSALLEVGISGAHLKQMKNSGYSEQEAASELMPLFKDGLAIVRSRFGEQPLIIEAEEAINRWDSEGSREKKYHKKKSWMEFLFPRFVFRIFLSRIMAEIKAQHNDQGFVVRIISSDRVVAKLPMLWRDAYYRRVESAGVATFIDSCFVLRARPEGS